MPMWLWMPRGQNHLIDDQRIGLSKCVHMVNEEIIQLTAKPEKIEEAKNAQNSKTAPNNPNDTLEPQRL